MHPAHPVGVAAGEVVVDGDDVHAVAGQRVQVGRQRRRPASCPHRSSSRRCCPGAARRRPSAGPCSGTGRGCAGPPRGRRRTPRAAGRRASRRRRSRSLERVGQRAQLGVGQIDVVVLEGLDVLGDAASRRTILPSPARSIFASTTGHGTGSNRVVTDWSQDCPSQRTRRLYDDLRPPLRGQRRPGGPAPCHHHWAHARRRHTGATAGRRPDVPLASAHVGGRSHPAAFHP